jgi:hypothetical protein
MLWLLENFRARPSQRLYFVMSAQVQRNRTLCLRWTWTLLDLSKKQSSSRNGLSSTLSPSWESGNASSTATVDGPHVSWRTMAKQAQSLDSPQMILPSTTCLENYWQFSYVIWTAHYFFIKAKRLGWSMRQDHGPSRNKRMLSLSIITICSKSKQMGWQGAEKGSWRNWLYCWRSCKNSISVGWISSWLLYNRRAMDAC